MPVGVKAPSSLSSRVVHHENLNSEVNLHWILLINFNFLRHPRILYCWKAIAKYRNVHARLCTLCLHACTYHSRSAKIIGSIHWIFLSNNFNFLHQPQILYCLEANAKYRNLHAHLCALHLHACTYCLKRATNFVS